MSSFLDINAQPDDGELTGDSNDSDARYDSGSSTESDHDSGDARF